MQDRKGNQKSPVTAAWEGSQEGPGRRGGGHRRGQAGGEGKRVSGSLGEQLLRVPTPARTGIERKDTPPPVFTAALLTAARHGNSPSVCGQRNG